MLLECCQSCEDKDISAMYCYKGKPCFDCPEYHNAPRNLVRDVIEGDNNENTNNKTNRQ